MLWEHAAWVQLPVPRPKKVLDSPSSNLGAPIMRNFRGVIIEESLTDASVLRLAKILSTRISVVTKKHQTQWLKKWTLHTVEIEREVADAVAEEISKSIDTTHEHPWYADFDDGKLHYIIFPSKIFKINMRDEKQYAVAKAYGIALGIPSYQVDFHPKERKVL